MRIMVAALLGVLCADSATALLAQGSDDVPVQRDLRRERRLERRLQDGQPPLDPAVTPDNPDGVVGFDGPPGLFDDNDVEESGPMAPGSPADIDDD